MKELILPDKSRIKVTDIQEISPLIESKDKKVIGFTIVTTDGNLKNVLYKINANYQKSRDKVESHFSELMHFWNNSKVSAK